MRVTQHSLSFWSSLKRRGDRLLRTRGVHPFKAIASLQCLKPFREVRKSQPDPRLGKGGRGEEEGEKEGGRESRKERREKRGAERAEGEGHVSKQRLHSERPLAPASLAGLWFLLH